MYLYSIVQYNTQIIYSNILFSFEHSRDSSVYHELYNYTNTEPIHTNTNKYKNQEHHSQDHKAEAGKDTALMEKWQDKYDGNKIPTVLAGKYGCSKMK